MKARAIKNTKEIPTFGEIKVGDVVEYKEHIVKNSLTTVYELLNPKRAGQSQYMTEAKFKRYFIVILGEEFL